MSSYTSAAPAPESSARGMPPLSTARGVTPARRAAFMSQTESPTNTLSCAFAPARSSAWATGSAAGLPSSTSSALAVAVMTSSASTAARSASSSAPCGGGGEHDGPPLPREGTQQLSRVLESFEAVEVGAVERLVRRADGVVLVRIAVVAEDVFDQVGAAQADCVVHGAHRHPVTGLPEGLPPGRDMQVVGVDERSVDVEQGGTRHEGSIHDLSWAFTVIVVFTIRMAEPHRRRAPAHSGPNVAVSHSASRVLGSSFPLNLPLCPPRRRGDPDDVPSS